MSIILYSTGESCHRCKIAATHLDRRGITYEVVDLMSNIEKSTELRQQGFNLAPVIRAEKDGEISWSEGYRPDFIDGLVESVAS